MGLKGFEGGFEGVLQGLEGVNSRDLSEGFEGFKGLGGVGRLSGRFLGRWVLGGRGREVSGCVSFW